MGARELDDWWRYYQEEPWGAARDNLHAGLVAAAVRNAFRSSRSKAVSWSDFMLIGVAEREARQAERSQQLVTLLRLLGKRRSKRGQKQ